MFQNVRKGWRPSAEILYNAGTVYTPSNALAVFTKENHSTKKSFS